MDVSVLSTLIVGGLTVLFVYVYVFARLCPGNYFTHFFWLKTPIATVRMLFVLQLLAAVGFMTSIISWLVEPPTDGVMSRPWALVSTLAAFLFSSAIWPLATYYKVSWLTVASLLTAASSSIVLLAGAMEELTPRWWVVLGWILLSTVTVLGDGVAWNARYIKTLIYEPSYFDQWNKKKD